MLLRELNRLKESAKEAVEGYNTLSQFKEYLHIERPIEREFTDIIRKRAEESGSVLVLLNGNVGDGKSHLISRIKGKYPSSMEKFIIHNDSTESFDPGKDSIETLCQVLKEFRDDQIHLSRCKMILAINLGILFRLSENSYFKTNFSTLHSLIIDSGILGASKTVTSFEKENLNIFSFSDYHLYELTEKGGRSSYIEGLLKKIGDSSEKNFFYQGYLQDKRDGRYEFYHRNFEFLMSEEIRLRIASLLIEIIVKNKLILSTRSILNFIYDILCQKDKLLPEALFNSSESSIILHYLSELDPINRRDERVDELLLELYNSDSPKNILEHLIPFKYLESLSPLFEELEKDRRYNSNFLEKTLRALYLFSSREQEFFQDKIYGEFMETLYYSANFNRKKIRRVSEDVMRSFYLWRNGRDFQRDRFIFTSSLGTRYMIAQELDWEVARMREEERCEEIISTFKPVIPLNFQNEKGECRGLSLDYKAFALIKEILSGYCPNGYDIENSLLYTEFLEYILKNWIRENSEIYFDTQLKREIRLTLKSYYDEDEYFLKEIY